MKLNDVSTEDLLVELNKRGLMTNSKTNDLVLKNKDKGNLKVILSFGEPDGELKCRECGEYKTSNNFSFYQARVDAKGYLMRSNALCDCCSKKSNKERQIVFENSEIPEKPKSGDICTNCEREWNGNWHRHHIEDKFIAYICGHCNMSFSDQRTKINLINEKK